MLRFLLIAFPLVLFELAAFAFVADVLELPPPFGYPLPLGASRTDLPIPWILAGWLLEATALVGVHLLVLGRTARRWLDGLIAAWSAWLFRGPLTILSLIGGGGLSFGLGHGGASYGESTIAGWLLYSTVGLSLAALGRPADSPAAASPMPTPTTTTTTTPLLPLPAPRGVELEVAPPAVSTSPTVAPLGEAEDDDAPDGGLPPPREEDR